MTDIKHETKQKASHSPEAEVLADAVLRAAGSGLRHYSMSRTREGILTSAQRGLDASRERLLTSLEYCIDQMEQCERMFSDDAEFIAALNIARAAAAEAKGLAV